MIVLDVDAVVCDFSAGLRKKYPEFIKHNSINYDLPSYINMSELYKDMQFWLNLPVLDKPTVHVDAYLSHRPFMEAITKMWLADNGFPIAQVYHVNSSEEKASILLKINPKIYVDDKVSTFEECRALGINAYLYTQPWNKHIVTEYRIDKLKELEKYV